MKKIVYVLLLTVAVNVTLFAQSQIPKIMTFQGFVTKDSAPYTGILPASFTLYDAPSGGNQVWNQQSQNVDVQNGYYGTVLDFSVNWQNGSNVNRFIKQFYLEVLISGNNQSPRIQLSASPYAMNALRADTADVALSLVLDAPKGSIMPFALNAYTLKTTIEPKGWRICDGSEVSLADCGGDQVFFSQLQAVYGYNSTTNKAYLPDFQGLFLRGVNGSRADSLAAPEKEQRFKTGYSTNTGDNVGTFQMDAIQNHHHWQKYFRYFEETNTSGMNRATQANIYGPLDYTDQSGTGTALQGHLRTGEVWSAATAKPGWGVPEDPVHLSHLETRPKNAAVYWLIKIK